MVKALPTLLIVAKPWQGGLADYLAQAARAWLGPERVHYVATRPTTLAGRLARARDKRGYDAALLQRIEAIPYDAAIFIHPLEVFAGLRAAADKHCVWLVDDGRISPALAAVMGHVFFSDPGYAAEVRASVGEDRYAEVLPFAMDPEMHRPAATPRTPTRAMCFIANRDAKRTAYLEALYAHGVDCTVYGNYFLKHRLARAHPTRFRPTLSIAAMGQVYARYRLSLNIHAAVVRAGTNMRSFEAAGYGVPQLVEHRPGIEALFEPEREIACFTQAEEAVAAYQRLLRDPLAAEQMAERARARVLAEHTYTHRLQRMLARV